MKKRISVSILLLIICCILCSCQSEYKEIETAIENLGEITIDSYLDLQKIQDSIAEIDSNKIDKISNYDVFLSKLDDYEIIKIDRAISELGDITLKSGNKLSSIQDNLNDLDVDLINKLENYNIFLDKQDEYNQLVEDQQQIDERILSENLQFNVQVEITANETAIFHITSNLPTGTPVMISLSGPKNYLAQDKVLLTNGNGSSSEFSNQKYNLPHGTFHTTFTTPVAEVYEEPAKSIIGENAKNLNGKGDCIQYESQFGFYQINYTVQFKVD